MKLSKIWLIAAGAVVLIGGGTYVGKALHYQNQQVFMNHTAFAGVDISGKSVSEATKLVNASLNQRKFKVTEDNNTVMSFSPQKSGIVSHTKHALKAAIKNQNPWSWPFKLKTVEATSDNITVDSITESSLNRLTNTILTETKQNRVATRNANLVYKDGQFTIKKEFQGNQISRHRLSQAIITALHSGNTTINLQNTYVKPTVTSKSAKLTSAKSQASELASLSVVYHLAGHKIIVSKNQLASWLTYQGGKVTVDQTKVKAYLSTLNAKYATINKTRTFKSTKRGTVKVKAGIYGWSIQTTSEAKTLAGLIVKGKDIDRTPTIQGSGYGKNGTDIGKTYVEVDKKNQHMWVYRNGKVVVSTDVVTGKPTKGTTPSGVYYVWSKQRNATLRGLNDDGSKYASKVSYWMPVDNTGVGIHDSSWQPKYGGTWYLTHGSHGCVNTPPSVMSKVYKVVSVGTPVIIF
ncbi:hypothetical protein LOSG293_050150 [Secundilactobacillus oryzae JCM 18671]|uniref:L,D-TPase catalytic domain-containing protein n=1 Tax=Secundilactobacillus oryzae JCM 18671 TaxID=1291743 RepID=A0A081BH27_9LACO|nr:L,D-transpeptidase family protein [Secundilactobacillus oryzae]GAK47345.1 hypothetical protein LOSG293_050150 [Secundilactobacillus oryzae JCM 18671]